MTEIKAGTGTSRNTGETKEIACSQAHYKPLNAACGNRKSSARPPSSVRCRGTLTPLNVSEGRGAMTCLRRIRTQAKTWGVTGEGS